jgi:hypothetical protein
MGTFPDIGRVAERQAGRVTRLQLRRCGITDSMIRRWVENGRLIPRLPKVYALGYASAAQESRLWEAVLYAGPGAMLSHMTAAQWCGYIKYAPAAVHVSTPRKIASLPSLVVHARRNLGRQTHAGVPTTTPAQTLLDLATVRPDLLERALGQLDFMGMLDFSALERSLALGLPGATALRQAIIDYDPNFQHLNEEFEIDFYELCREWKVEPLPIPNVELQPGHTIDALWPDHRLGVELDGKQNHSSDAQLLRDADRDLAARRLGLTIIRYRRAQIKRTPQAVREDLLTQLARHSP